MTAGGALIRDQPRFASKRSDADDLLHPLLAPGTWNAISPLEKVRHRIAPSRNAQYSRKTRLRVKRFPLRSVLPYTTAMPIRPYLDKHRFDAETTRLMGFAFETAIVAPTAA
jgi:hypothetical protein